MHHPTNFIHFLTGLLAGLWAQSATAQIPVVGIPVPELSILDTEMTTFMEANDISAGSLSVMHNGVIVFHHTYGWQDQAESKPIRPDALFRVSVTKPFTAPPLPLIADDALSGHKGIQQELPVSGFSIMPLRHARCPAATSSITSFDTMVAGPRDRRRFDLHGSHHRERDEYTSPPGRENTMRYIMGQPLQYDPDPRLLEYRLSDPRAHHRRSFRNRLPELFAKPHHRS